jgi:triosephosphate isomerase
MRQPLVAGNWKMNGTKASVESLLSDLKAGFSDALNAEVAVCPSFIFLEQAAALLKDSGIVLGSQNVCDQDKGAFTGEVSAPMLKEAGVKYAIVGHSERRHVYGETDALVAARFAAAKNNGLVPILCVGEKLEERESGVTEKVVEAQIDAVIELLGIEGLKDAVIAYEPVWAIGTGKTATPDQAQDVHAFIRAKLAKQDAALADSIQILYGGSMNAANAADLLSQADIDGGLIGGAALKAEDFLTICRAA